MGKSGVIALKLFVAALLIFFAFCGVWAIVEWIPGLGVFPLVDIGVKKAHISELIPSDAEIVALARLDNLDISAVENLVKQSPFYDSISGLVDKSIQNYEGFLNPAKDILPWIGSEAGLFTITPASESLPSFLLLVETKNTGKTKRLMNRLTGFVETNKQLKKREYKGISIATYSLDLGTLLSESSDPGNSKSVGLSVALVHNFLVINFGSSDKTLEKVIDLALNGGATFVLPESAQPEKHLITIVDRGSKPGEDSSKDKQITFDFKGSRLAMHYSGPEVAQGDKGGVVAFTPTLASHVPDKTVLSVYSIPTLDALLTYSQQKLVLPLSLQRERFVAVQQPLLGFDVIGTLLPALGGEATLIEYDDGFGVVATVTTIQKAMQAMESFQQASLKGIYWNALFKPGLQGEQQPIAFATKQGILAGKQVYFPDTEAHFFVANLGDSLLQDAQSVVQLAASEEVESIPFAPSYAFVDNTLAIFSSKYALKYYLDQQAVPLLGDTSEYKKITDGFPSNKKVYAEFFGRKGSFTEGFGEYYSALTSLPFDIPFLPLVIEQLAKTGEQTGFVLYPENGMLQGDVVIELKK